MSSWTKKSVPRRTVKVSAGSPVQIETDPSLIREIAGADDKRSFLYIETIDSSMTVKAWRHEGARPDLLKQLDASGTPILSVGTTGVHDFNWSTPLGSASKVTLEVSITAGSGSVTLEMDDVYRTRGA